MVTVLDEDLAELQAYAEKGPAVSRATCARVLAELERLRTEGTPGVMHKVDRAFYRETVAQRDRAWRQLERLAGVQPGADPADVERALVGGRSATPTRDEVLGPCGDLALVPKVEVRRVTTADGDRVEVALLSDPYCWRVRSWWTPEQAAVIADEIHGAALLSRPAAHTYRIAWCPACGIERTDYEVTDHGPQSLDTCPNCGSSDAPTEDYPRAVSAAWASGEPCPQPGVAAGPQATPDPVLFDGTAAELDAALDHGGIDGALGAGVRPSTLLRVVAVPTGDRNDDDPSTGDAQT